MAQDILLIGVPGSGKGTQALKLVEKKQFFHLSTGDLFRKNLKDKTKLGSLVQSYLDKGQLVPDFLTNEMVRDCIKNLSSNQRIVWDGFPRNMLQAEAFKEILLDSHRALNQVIYLKISDQKVLERLIGRLYAPKSGLIYHRKYKTPKREGFCDVSGEALVSRSDDHKEVIQSRLSVFYKETLPLLDYYKQKKLLKTINAEVSPEEIFKLIENNL